MFCFLKSSILLFSQLSSYLLDIVKGFHDDKRCEKYCRKYKNWFDQELPDCQFKGNKSKIRSLIRKLHFNADGSVNLTVDYFNELKSKNREQKKELDELKKQTEITEKLSEKLLAENKELKKKLDEHKKQTENTEKLSKKLLAENREQKKELDEHKKFVEMLRNLLFICIFLVPIFFFQCLFLNVYDFIFFGAS